MYLFFEFESGMTKNVKRSMRVCEELVIRPLMFVCVVFVGYIQEDERERERIQICAVAFL